MENTPTVFTFGDEMKKSNPLMLKTTSHEKFEELNIYPANLFVTSPDVLQTAIHQIQEDLSNK